MMAELDQKQLISRLEKVGQTSRGGASVPARAPALAQLKYDYLVRLSQSLLKEQKNLRDYVQKTQQALNQDYIEAEPTDVVHQAVQVLDTAIQANRSQWRVFNVQECLPMGYVSAMMQDSHKVNTRTTHVLPRALFQRPKVRALFHP